MSGYDSGDSREPDAHGTYLGTWTWWIFPLVPTLV